MTPYSNPRWEGDKECGTGCFALQGLRRKQPQQGGTTESQDVAQPEKGALPSPDSSGADVPARPQVQAAAQGTSQTH